jgi:hypothetical protein
MMAYDLSFNESDLSSEIYFFLQDTEGPPPPVLIQASSEVGSVTLTWNEPEDAVDVYGYRIFRGTESGFNPQDPIVDEETLTSSVFEFIDTDVDPCRTYYYRIASVDCENVGTPSDEIFGDGDGAKEDYPNMNITNTTPNEDPVQAPAMVSGLSASGQAEAVQLNWINSPDIDFAGVIVRWSNGGYPYNPQDGYSLDDFTGPAGDPMSFHHENLQTGQTYYYSFFSYDHCGNFSDAAQISAFTGDTGPIVEIRSPSISGSKITNGVLIYHAQAYDPDEAGLSIPPNIETDNGKGITQMEFHVDPNPAGSGFPRTQYVAGYCGFGGSSNPCSAGDVSNWCDGTYNLFTVAYDNEGMSNQSNYIEIEVENGGLNLDDTFTNFVSGTYKQEMNTRMSNTSDNVVTVKGATPSWNRSNARLTRIEMPEGTTIWEAADFGLLSGQEIEFESWLQPSISAGQQMTAKFVFSYWFDRLSVSATAGTSRLYLMGETSHFTAGSTIYLSLSGSSEAVTVDSVGSGYVDLVNPLQNGWGLGTYVSEVQNIENCPMTTSQVNLTFDYEFSGGYQECRTGEYQVMVADGPMIMNPQQDKPSENLDCNQTVGAIEVPNYRSVPVHINIVDGNMQGLNRVRVYYKYTSYYTTYPPSYGYARINLNYDSTHDYWAEEIPYQSDRRVWFYFYVRDNTGETVREPASGAFTYDHKEDNTPPNCPLGLVATRISQSHIDLTWNESSEDDVLGYNIYRSKECGYHYKIYTQVSDQDSTTPGVQFADEHWRLNTNYYCYSYYITAVDMEGNESEGCSVYYSSAGDCPCGS